ncbi:MAG: magnesium/cobalt transporter CorA, partial [Gammaproteobacteria bacterium]|nr:magnesium/cobalt transporter CorA [Gammaproteobacteria bacterium]
GTLIGDENAIPDDLKIHLIDYTSSNLVENELATIEECQSYLSEDSTTWIHVQGLLQTKAVKNIGNLFGLHPLALEDVLNKGQRPKMEEYDDLIFVIMTMPIILEETTIVEQISIFMGNNYIISFHAGTHDPFEILRNRLRKKMGRIRNHKVDYLLYSLLDLTIDQGYPVLEKFGENMEIIEEELLYTKPKQSTLAEIHQIRRELLLLRRNLWPQRDVLNNLLRSENSLIAESTSVYLRDCYDHSIQIMDILENFREMATSLIDVYLSSASHRLSEIMRILTMISTIFIPLTFVVGLYGMNFSHPDSPWSMPELHWYYGYPFAWGIMAVIVISMVFYFKRKNWL